MNFMWSLKNPNNTLSQKKRNTKIIINGTKVQSSEKEKVGDIRIYGWKLYYKALDGKHPPDKLILKTEESIYTPSTFSN